MKKYLIYLLVCVILVTGLIPASADYLGPNPEARIYTVTSGVGTTEIQAGNATASHTITCTGTTGVQNWCNNNETITINGTEPKPDNYLNGAELDDGNDVQSIHGSRPPYVFTYRREGDNFADYWVRSTVGDTSEMYEAEFRIDKTAPTASCEIESVPEYNEWYVGTVVIRGTSTDSISDIQKEQFTAGSKTSTGSISLNETASNLLVKLTATDYATNTHTIDCATVSIDNTKPVIDSYTQFSNGDLFGPVVKFTMAAHDAHSGIQYMAFIIDGTEYDADSSGSYEMEYAHGNHTVIFKAVDNVGNVQQTSAMTFYVDAKAPTFTINTPVLNGKPNLVTYGSEITGTASDEGGGFGKVYSEYPGSSGFEEAIYARGSKSKYAESGTWSVELPTSGLQSGYATVSVKGKDIFNNESDVYDKEVLVDVTKPVPDFELGGTLGVTDWYTGAVTITGLSEDEHSGVMTEIVSYSGPANGSGSHTTTIPATASGIFGITVDATDYANNNAKLTTGQVKVDNTVPVIDSMTQFEEGDLFGPVVHFEMSASDAHSGVQRMTIIIDGEENDVDASGAVELELEHGFHTVIFQVTDNVNLVTKTASKQFYVDAKAPEAEINVPSMNGQDHLVTYESVITGVVSDEGGGFGKVLVEYPGSNGFEQATYTQTAKERYSESGTWTVTLPAEGLESGMQTISVKAEDIFGNISEITSMEVLVDVTKPVPSYELSGTLGVTDWYTGAATITGTSEDEHSGVMTEIVSYNGEAGSDSAEDQVIVPASYSGVFDVTVEVTDFANNTDSITDASALKLDNTAPEFVTMTEPDPDVWVGTDLSLSVSGKDDHSGVQSISIIIEGNGQTDEQTFDGSELNYDKIFTASGDYTIKYKIVDNVNLETESEAYTIHVDVTPPVATISTPSINGKENLINVNTEISGSSTDDGSGVKTVYAMLPGETEWSVVSTSEGGSTVLDWSKVFSNEADLPSGNVTIKAKAEDLVGNVSEIAELEVLLDVTLPIPDYEIDGREVDGWYYGPVTVNNTSVDEHSGIFETTISVECDPEFTVSGTDSILIEGSYSGVCSVFIEVLDYAGNTDSILDENVIRIDVDNESPEIDDSSVYVGDTELSTVAKFYPPVEEVCFEAKDNHSGLNTAFFIYDDDSQFTAVFDSGAGENDWVQICVPYHLDEGEYTVSLKVTDRVGNESGNDQKYNMIIDGSGPTVRFTSAPSIYKPSERSLTYTGIVEDPGSGVEVVEYSTDGGYTFEEIDLDNDGKFTINVAPEARMTVMIRAVDKVGNEMIIESEPLQKVSDASSRLVVYPAVVANMVIKPSIIDHDGSISYDFSGISSARAFVYGRGFDHAEIEMLPENNYAFMWDGYFPTEVKAPKGWYWLTVEFTDLLGKVECYNSRIWVDWDEPEPEKSNEPQYRTFDISGTVNELDRVSVTVNGSRYMLADFSKVASDIAAGSQVTGKGRAYTKENVLVIETLERIPDKQMPFNGLIDDLGKDYVIIDGHALVIDENTKFYCVDTRVGDYVSGLYTVDSLNRMYVTEFGPLSCERDVITRVDSGIVY